MPKPSTKDLRILLDAVEIVFTWCGDRWSHAIHFPGHADAATWRSVEGPEEPGGDAAWPVSPVIVELSPVPSAAAVVGVGRAGRSHFSVSFTAKPADTFTAKPADSVPDGSGSHLFVECACRIQEPPGWLGSTYRKDGSAGPSSSLVRIPAAIDHASPSLLPRTVTWSYFFSPTGPVAGEPPR